MSRESEQLFLQNRGKLITLTTAIGARLNTAERAEGADIKSERWVLTENGSATDNAADLLLYPYDEIKAVNEILTKDWKYNNGETSGTLPIEIFNKWSWNPSEYHPYAGWILALFNPELLSEKKREWNERTRYKYNVPEAVYRPGNLVFFLYHGEQLKEQPFACIAFERIEELKQRIKYCLPREWDLESWNLPPLTDEYWKQFIDFDNGGYTNNWDAERGGMVRNNWIIPLRTLADLGTFTLIGDQDLDTEHRYKKLQRLEEIRLQYIQRQANGRKILI